MADATAGFILSPARPQLYLGKGTDHKEQWKQGVGPYITKNVFYTREKNKGGCPRKCVLSNEAMPVSILENKANFYKLASQCNCGFLPRTYLSWDNLKTAGQDEMIILKPNGGADAEGITIKKAPLVAEADMEGHTAQRLITNLLLYEGRKFHVRMLYLWRPGNVAYLMWNGMILASPFKYDSANPDPRIQITNGSFHQRQDNSHVRAPLAFKGWDEHDKLLRNVQGMGQELFDCLESSEFKRPMQSGQYDLYGLDVLFTAEGECKLLEVNVYWSMQPDPELLAMAGGAFGLMTRGIKDGHEAAKLDAFVYQHTHKRKRSH